MLTKNKEQIKNIEAQISQILRTPSLGRNLLVLIKKECIVSQKKSRKSLETGDIRVSGVCGEPKIFYHRVLWSYFWGVSKFLTFEVHFLLCKKHSAHICRMFWMGQWVFFLSKFGQGDFLKLKK